GPRPAGPRTLPRPGAGGPPASGGPPLPSGSAPRRPALVARRLRPSLPAADLRGERLLRIRPAPPAARLPLDARRLRRFPAGRHRHRPDRGPAPALSRRAGIVVPAHDPEGAPLARLPPFPGPRGGRPRLAGRGGTIPGPPLPLRRSDVPARRPHRNLRSP